jgi:uridine kinase
MIITRVKKEGYNCLMQRDDLVETIADMIARIRTAHPLRVAVDGIDASGKTVFADELAQSLVKSQRPVIRVSVDGFHLPKAVRWQKGPLSPEGFYRDSFNYPALIENLLLPLSPQGCRRYRTAVFDLRQDCTLGLPWQIAEDDAILIFDGIFLHRHVLLPHWDVTLFLQVDFDNAVIRGVARDRVFFGTKEEALLRYEQRYVPGQKTYFKEAGPLDKAHILIDNNNLDEPEIIKHSVKPQEM